MERSGARSGRSRSGNGAWSGLNWPLTARSNVIFHGFHKFIIRASVKLFELGVRTPGGLFLGVWYAGGIDFRRRTRSVPIFGIISDLLETMKPTSKYIYIE